MSGDDNVSLALAWLDAWGRGDAETVSGAMDPAVEIHSARLPSSGSLTRVCWATGNCIVMPIGCGS